MYTLSLPKTEESIMETITVSEFCKTIAVVFKKTARGEHVMCRLGSRIFALPCNFDVISMPPIPPLRQYIDS